MAQNQDAGSTRSVSIATDDEPHQEQPQQQGWALVRFLAENLASLPKVSAMDRYLAHLRSCLRRVGYTYRRFALNFEPICRPQQQIQRLGAFVLFDERQPMHISYMYCPFAASSTQILAGRANLPYRRLLSKEDLIDAEKIAYSELVDHAMFFENAPVNAEREGVTVILYPLEDVRYALFNGESWPYLAGFELDRQDKRAIEDRMDADRAAISAARERILAFCMGAHARLGASSFVNRLDSIPIMEIVRQFILLHVF
jgi:hypothetical protein